MSTSATKAPEALLFIATGCAHCPLVLEHLGRLVKEGALGRLEVVNIGQRPQLAAEYGVRSVPWYRIGGLELSGARTLEELRLLVREVQEGQAQLRQLEEFLSQRQLSEALALVESEPEVLNGLIPWLGDLEKPFDLRLGIGALLEELRTEATREAARAPLEALLGSGIPQVRADAAHYLGITGQKNSMDLVRALLDDPDTSVREIAAETLDILKGDA